MKDLIKQLAETWGPSGYEHQVRALIQELVADYADEMRVDPLGNLICRVGSGGKKVMIAAHMDEIGLMATYQEPTSGYLRFEQIGGLIQTTLAGTRVRFEDGTIGVIGIHDQWGAGRTKASDLNNFFVDVSYGDDKPFQIGQPAAFDSPVVERGNRLSGRAMDDRVGCAIAIETMRRMNRQAPNEVYFVFTVQEEVGLRGAQTSAYGVQADIGIAIDVTATGDTPQNIKMAVELGKGTAIKVKDAGMVVPPEIRDWMVNTAEANNIPYQLELLPFGSTDARAIQLSHIGVPTGAISIPCRYVHTNNETVDMTDVSASVDLLAALLSNPIALGAK